MLVLSLIGNPVKVGDEPIAVIPPLLKGTLSALLATVLNYWNGKAAGRVGKSEDLSE